VQQLPRFLVEVEGGIDDQKAPVVAAMHRHADRGVVKTESPVDAFARLRVSVLDQVGMQRVECAAVGDQGDMFRRAGQYFIEDHPRAAMRARRVSPPGGAKSNSPERQRATISG
jgi:FAD/FMN-containing dehydrogenase